MNTVTITVTETDTVAETEKEKEDWRDSWVIEQDSPLTNKKLNQSKKEIDRTWFEYLDKMWNISVIFGVSSIIYLYISRSNTSKF
jgi:hypothetical protein